MDIKYCPQCGKEIPVEAHFCPYCMTKLIAEDGTKIPVVKKNKRKKLYIIMALTLGIIIIEMIILMILFSTDNKSGFRVYVDNSIGMNSQKEDYSEYLEVWIDYDTLNGDYKYCYKGIDNTRTREDVKEIFKEQNVSEEDLYLDDTSYYPYWSSEEEVMSQIYFNDDGYVQSIRYSML